MPRITPFLWFDEQAEDAARFYAGIFPNSRIIEIARYPNAVPDKAGRVMTVTFELDGRDFVALNGGSTYKLSEATSFAIDCADQAEVDYYWEKLTAGGEPRPCGWLKDRFGLFWQVTPRQLIEMVGDPDAGRAERAMRAMFTMEKIDIETIRQAWAG